MTPIEILTARIRWHTGRLYSHQRLAPRTAAIHLFIRDELRAVLATLEKESQENPVTAIDSDSDTMYIMGSEKTNPPTK